MSILRASIDSPGEELPRIVPDADYRGTFLKLTRNLAPTGKRFNQLDIRATDESHPVSLVPGTRTTISQVLRTSRPAALAEPETEQTLRGVLRALHLDQDWIEVTVDSEHIRIEDIGEAVDDVIGPMVNHSVVVDVVRDARGKLHYRDIESDE